ncbi:TatD family hydrolase [Patescibacteria group bacterium]|nr:TatD family hydrolase [Patescibacteria group bacterium]
MIDTHCHLDMLDNIPEKIKRAKENNITHIINPGISLESTKKAHKLSSEYDNVYFLSGIHPEELLEKSYEDILKDLKEIEEIAKDKKCLGIGEIGFEYHYENLLDKKQKELFKKQIEIAEKLNKPIIIHSRDSFTDTYNILKNNTQKTLIHCFDYGFSEMEKFLELGFYISFTGMITFKNARKEIIECVKRIPENKLLIETDAPFLSPEPKRGEKNEPAFVKYILEKISEIKNIDIKHLENIVNQNTKDFFQNIY